MAHAPALSDHDRGGLRMHACIQRGGRLQRAPLFKQALGTGAICCLRTC